MSQENVEVVRQLYRAWNNGRAGWDYLTPDHEWDVSRWAPDLPVAARGREQTRDMARTFLNMWAEVRFEPERFIERGDLVGVVVNVHTRGEESGVPTSERLGHLFTFRDGLVARFVLYPNPEEALAAVGLSE